MVMRLSAMTPSPTQRFIPVSPLYRQWLRPCRRLTTNQFLLLLASALRAFGRAIGKADVLDTLGKRRRLVLGRVECGVGGQQARSASEPRVNTCRWLRLASPRRSAAGHIPRSR